MNELGTPLWCCAGLLFCILLELGAILTELKRKPNKPPGYPAMKDIQDALERIAYNTAGYGSGEPEV